jgi:Type I restriction enzyme R protein N terminus (HSDR_N)
MSEEPVWADFARRWRELHIESLNEQGVREEFVAPLLRMLGYSGGTIAGVLYEQNKPLPPAFRKDRQPSIRPDYILTYRLERFWLLEVKRPRTLDQEAFAQAQFYAVHPRVRARYMVISAGLQIRVYDAWAESFDEPRVVIERESATDTFEALYELLAAKLLLAVIRRDVLTDLERALAAEIDERAPDEFLAAVHGVVSRSRPLIRKNVRQLVVEAFRKEQEKRGTSLRGMELRGLLWMIEQPTQVFADRSNELYRRISESAPDQRASIAHQVLSLGDGLCRIPARYHVLRVLLLAADTGLEELPFDALAEATRFARENLAYRSDDALADFAHGLSIDLHERLDLGIRASPAPRRPRDRSCR